MTNSDPFIWTVRTYIYEYIVATTQTPDLATIAAHFALSKDAAGEILLALHGQHALFLESGTLQIRIANPFSALPTPFVTESNGKRYWANCAWDALGVIVATGATAGRIHATCAADQQPLAVEVVDGAVVDSGAIAHVLVPFRHWYDDLVFT